MFWKGSPIIKKILLSSIALIFLALFSIGQAQAATLSMSSSPAQVKVGELITVRAFINTQGKVINNAEGVLIFNKDLVEVISLSTSGTIFSLWVEQPSFSNSAGRISFNGGVPNPGYEGSSGGVFSAVFRAKATGTAAFSFTSLAIRENDGLGTNILTGQGSASVAIVTVETTKPESPSQPEDKPVNEPTVNLAPTISSSIYTNQDNWYSAISGLVSWRLPSDTTAVQTLLNNSPNTTPTLTFRPAIYERQLNGLEDGIWYFHLRYQKNGQWSPTSHYRIQIDTVAPTDLLVETIQLDSNISLNLSAEDSLSGISHYVITVNNQDSFEVSSEEAKNKVPLRFLQIGTNQILVTVYDQAGNKTESTSSLSVEPLIGPIIDDYPEKVSTTDRIILAGSSFYANSKVRVTFKSESGEIITYDVLTDKSGYFSLDVNPISAAGQYQVWANLLKDDGTQSPKSNIFYLEINDSAGSKFGLSFAVSLQTILITIGIIFLAFILIYGWYLAITLRRKLNLVEKRSSQTLSILINRANEQIYVLNKIKNKPELSPEEIRALEDLIDTIKKINEMKNLIIK